MKRLVMMLMVLVAMGGTTDVSTQSFLKKLGKKIEETAKRKEENKVERTTEKAMDAVLDGKGTSNNNNGNNNADAVYDNEGATAQTQPQKGQSLETTYAKSDFVPGDEIIFEDLVDNEQLGEFPSMWDLKKGNAEVATVNGKKAITFGGENTTIAPLMKDMTNYLPEKFTLEMDLIMAPERQNDSWYELNFYNADKREIMNMYIDNKVNNCVEWTYTSTSGDRISGSFDTRGLIQTNDWHHLAISFNKRALKIYIDGIRIANIPNMSQPANFDFQLI